MDKARCTTPDVDNQEQQTEPLAAESNVEDKYEPTYNLKAVVRETGLKADTLRAWERRYGLPQPKRTPSRHRLYSRQDIGILKWLLARQNEGLSISRAVALWQRLTEEGVDPIDADEFVEAPPLPTASSTVVPVNNGGQAYAPPSSGQAFSLGGHITDMRLDWISACLVYDEPKAEQILASAFSHFDAETVCIELLLKGISEIGSGWSHGRVTVQQEHFASSLAIRRLHSLYNGTPPPTRSGKILVGCSSGEEHTFSSILISLLLRRQGWSVLYLGANIPLRNLSDTVAITQPNLAIITAQQLHTAATLVKTGNVLYDSGIPMAYGGAIFVQSPTLERCVPGYYLGNDISKVTMIVEQLMSAPRVRPAQRSVPRSCIDALHAYREGSGEIEKDVRLAMQDLGAEWQLVEDANQCLSKWITASLSLSKTDDTQAELEEVRTLLNNHYHMPPDLTETYLGIYHNATVEHCRDVDPVVTDWLSKLLVADRVVA